MKRLDNLNDLWTPGTELIVPAGPEAPVQTDEMSIALTRMEPGGEPVAPHYHIASIEIYVVVSGKGSLTVNGETSIVEPGAVVMMERRDVHSMAQVGDEELVCWAISTPPWYPEDHIPAEAQGFM